MYHKTSGAELNTNIDFRHFVHQNQNGAKSGKQLIAALQLFSHPVASVFVQS